MLSEASPGTRPEDGRTELSNISSTLYCIPRETRIQYKDIYRAEDLNSKGVIIDGKGGVPAVGIWLMPDNGSTGELEDFVIKMIKESDPVWPLAQSYVDNIPDDDRKFSSAKSDKAKLYAWLATRKKPNRMGAAIGAGDLVTETQLNSLFMDWLSKLFG